MNAKHTPAPWTVPHFARPDVNCQCEYVLCDHVMGAVATVHCSGEGDCPWDNPKFEEAVANAHLIAAAPDMLEALKTLLRRGVIASSWEETARAAIAKAEGQA